MQKRRGLIGVHDLAGRLDQAGAGLAVVDLRQDPADGLPKIPGSIWAGLHNGFAQQRPDRNLQYDLPTPEEFSSAMSRLGVTPQMEVALLDDMGNRWATRVYWLLSYYRHPADTFVLDGGIRAYLDAGLPTVPEFSHPEPQAYPVPKRRNESIRATAEYIAARLETGALTLCDVRTPQEHSGEVAMSGRGGHIPGAINIPWDACLRQDGTFLPGNGLAKVLAPYLDDRREQITYCQGGIRASLTWFALQVLLGRPARLYAASWEEWASRPELPVVT